MTWQPSDKAVEAALRKQRQEFDIDKFNDRGSMRAALIAAHEADGFHSVEEFNAASVEDRQYALINQQIDELVTMSRHLDLLTDAMRFIAEGVSVSVSPEDTAGKFRAVALTALARLHEHEAPPPEQD